MAFLDNSGDIILDAVLTDTGRLRLAQGDGSFKISKFALGDDEINYALYDKDHLSGSAYYDLEVLQTPILEAFTNNTSNLKTKLISLSRTNMLFMPVTKLNKNVSTVAAAAARHQNGFSQTFYRRGSNPGGGAPNAETYVNDVDYQPQFYVAVDQETMIGIRNFREGASTTNLSDGVSVYGLLQGYNPTDGLNYDDIIRVDQGLDTNEVAASGQLDSDLRETAYILEMDYRLGRIKGDMDHTPQAVNFIDDDNIATYYLTQGFVDKHGFPGTKSVISDAGVESFAKSDLDKKGFPTPFEGPRGSTLQFRIHASQELQSSTYLFNQIGNSVSALNSSMLGFPGTDGRFTASTKIYYIDSTVRVVGANTGYRLDIPVRYIKIA